MKSLRPAALSAAPWIVLLLATVADPATASTRTYALDLPAGQTLSYHVEVEVEHPGVIAVEAGWTGSRIVSFLLVGPTPVEGNLRRAGPSPQRLELRVPETGAGPGKIWTLRIRALPSRDDAEGTIEIRLPEPPGRPARARETSPAPKPAHAPAEPWREALVPGVVPLPELERLFHTVETFRAGVVDGTFERPDRYRWQDALLRFLALRRDALAADEGRPAYSTRLFLERVVGTIRQTEALQHSEDPLVTGPPPQEARKRRAWLVVRRQRVAPLERDLDALLSELQAGHVPELTNEPWPARLLSSMTACERFFEERGRLSPERARYREVAEQQWTPILAAAEALESLMLLSDGPQGR